MSTCDCISASAQHHKTLFNFPYGGFSRCIQAQADKGDTSEGLRGCEFMEHWALSTQALLFAFVHWHKTLGDAAAKASSHDLMNSLLDKVLGKQSLVCFLRHDMKPGTILSSGVQLAVQNGSFLDVRALADDFPVMKTALNRTKHSNNGFANHIAFVMFC